MNNTQLFLAIGLPLLFNTALVLQLKSRMDDGFRAINQRFDDMRELWKAELNRVEGVLDARLKHLEETK